MHNEQNEHTAGPVAPVANRPETAVRKACWP
jgi:hypothetical protein